MRSVLSAIMRMQGRWYITAGQNPLFDVFDCQEHFFGVQDQGKCPWLTVCLLFVARNARLLHHHHFCQQRLCYLELACSTLQRWPPHSWLTFCRGAARQDQLAHPQGQDGLHRSHHCAEVQAAGVTTTACPACHTPCLHLSLSVTIHRARQLACSLGNTAW